MSCRGCLSIGSFYSKKKKNNTKNKNAAVVEKEKENIKNCLNEETAEDHQVRCNVFNNNVEKSSSDDSNVANDFVTNPPEDVKKSTKLERSNSQTSLISVKAQNSASMEVVEPLWRIIRHSVLKEKNTKSLTPINPESMDLEECERLLERPSLKKLIKINNLLSKCTTNLLMHFLQSGCLQLMFEALSAMNSYKYCLNNAVMILQIVNCIKTVISNHIGIEYLLEDKKMLVYNLLPTLDTSNTMVKKQVFEMLSAVCLYNNQGYQLALSSLEHFKNEKSQRYRFSIIINELKNAELLAYKTTIIAFINVILMSTMDYTERRNLRNEFIGLGLLDLLTTLRHEQEEEIFIQISVFDEQKQNDDEMMITSDGFNLNDHQQVFNAVFQQIAEKPAANNFLAILQSLLVVSEENEHQDLIWNTIEDVVVRVSMVTSDASSVLCKQKLEKDLVGLHQSILGKCEKETQTELLKKHNEIKESKETQTEKLKIDELLDQNTNCKKCGQLDQPLLTNKKNDSQTASIPQPPPPPFILSTPTLTSLSSSPPPPPPPPPPMFFLPSLVPNSVNEAIPPPPPLPGAPFLLPNGVPPPPPPPPLNGGPPLPPLLPGAAFVGLPIPGGVPPPPPFFNGGAPAPPPLPGIGGLLPGGVPPPPSFPGCIPSLPPGIPPPPGGLFASNLKQTNVDTSNRKLKPAKTPSQKMKKLQWSKIPPHVLKRSSSSVWRKVVEVKGVEPDYGTEEELFCQKEIVKEEKKEEKKCEPKEIAILDGKRSMNVNIFLRQFKGGFESVLALIKQGNATELGVDRLKCLEKLLPDTSEKEQLKEFRGEKEKLGSAEKFFIALINLSSYELRIKSLILKEEFEIAKESLGPNIKILKQAIEGILQCEILPEILNLILRIGNFMNHGSHAGDAEAFKITSLLKLSDTRANKPRMNLLHFIVQIAEDKKEELMQFPDKMADVLQAACRLNIDNLEKEVTVLSKNLESTKKSLKKAPSDVKEQMGSFLKESKLQCLELETNIKDIRNLCCQFAEYFCEDATKFKVEEYLSIFLQFSTNLKKAKEENEQFKLQEKQRLARELKQAEEKARQEKLGISVKGKKKPAERVEEKCIVDSLMDEIKNGFPLRKNNLKTEKLAVSNQKSSKSSELQWKKAKTLASFIVTGKSVDEPLVFDNNLNSVEKKDNSELIYNVNENTKTVPSSNRFSRTSKTENEYIENVNKDDRGNNCNEDILLFKVTNTDTSTHKNNDSKKHNGINDITNENLTSEGKTNSKENVHLTNGTGSIKNKIKPTKSNESISSKRKNSCFEDIADENSIKNKENALYTIAHLKKKVIESGNIEENDQDELNIDSTETSVIKNPKRRKSEASMKKNCKVS